MAQHDYVINNQSAPNARSDINNVLQAILTHNSGATAPATMVANMIWYDTSTDLLKIRNEANTGWITLGTVDQTNNIFIPNFLASQAEAEAGSSNIKGMTPLRVSQAIAALVPAGTTVNYQSFTATGTWTKPAGISANAVVVVQVWAGGGGGGKGNSTNTAAGGGGGGAFVQATYLASALSATQAVTVGAGGVSISASGSGNNGGSSSFSTAIVYGGEGGPGGASSGSRNGSHGGSWIAAYTDNNGSGYKGDGTVEILPDQFGGGGGSTTTSVTTVGGYFGGGGGKSSGSTGASTSVFGGSGGTAATAGTAPAGGGGGVTYAGGSSGAGARGEVRVWTIG